MPISSLRRPQQVRSRLEAMARLAGVGAQLPKAEEICRELSISRRTLDFALGDLESEGIIERKRGVGIFVAKRPLIDSHLLLIFHPDFFLASSHTPFWRLLIEAARERARSCEGSFDIHFCRAEGMESALSPGLEAEILAGEVAGVIGVGLREDLARFLEENVPFVSLAGWSNHIVGFDTESFAAQGVARLRELGCQRIGFVSGVAPHRFIDARSSVDVGPVRAFERQAKMVGCFWPQWVFTHFELVPQGGGVVEKSLQEQGFEAAQKMWVQAPRQAWPDGVLVHDELLMQGIWSALNIAELSGLVGSEIHLVSHANGGSPALLECQERLDRLVYEPRELVSLLFDGLESLIAGQTVPPIRDARPHLLCRGG